MRTKLAMLAVLASLPTAARAQNESIEPRLLHLRSGEAREWASFPAAADGAHAEFRWQSAKNSFEQTLMLRQQDVKQSWRVRVNDTQVGTLTTDENDMRLYLPLADEVLRDGENVLRIEPADRGASSDDIRVGEIHLDARPLREVLGEAQVEVQVVDKATGEPLPARITITSAAGALQPTSATSNDDLAVRTGVIYTKTGAAKFGLPAGDYTIYAGRGFEYSVAQVAVKLAAGETSRPTLKIEREVPTEGYVACDTHIHTLTFSGHGDATIAERMITLAGEGIELPIATDHNIHVDYEEHAKRLGVRKYFTPVMGNEYTTTIGHFNLFPVESDGAAANAKVATWAELGTQINGVGARAAILNHARDLHSGTRPFGAKLWNAAVGARVDGATNWFNALEIVNAGATQTDPLQLARDWMTILNNHLPVTPIGSSDSHDVSRYIVGQARTYIRCDDADPAKIKVGEVIDNLLAQRVAVSYGLFTKLKVYGEFGPGEFAKRKGEEGEAFVVVVGPSWVNADCLRLFVNGELAREIKIDPDAPRRSPEVKFAEVVRFPLPRNDVHVVAIASGPGVTAPYWPMAKPYQPTSPEFQAQALGISGPVWIDCDGNGRRQTAYMLAMNIVAKSGDLAALVKELERYDVAVAVQAAREYHHTRPDMWLDELRGAADDAAPAVAEGFRRYIAAWRKSELARAEP